MGDINENLLKAVRHYQDSLDRHTENRNENKLLHYLDRLYKLPIKVMHLEQTGVGRTVNGLRKLGGEVGEQSRRLVTKWKEMVVGEQEEEDEEDDEDGYQTGEEQSSDGESRNHEREKVRENSSSHRKSDKNHNGTDDKEKVRKNRENSSKSSHSSESKSSSEKDRHKENGHDRHKSHKRKPDSDSEDESPKKRRKNEDESRHRRRVESDSEEDKRSRERKHKKSDKKKSRESSVDDDSDREKSKDRRHKSDKKKNRDSSMDDSDREKSKDRRHKSDKKKTRDSSVDDDSEHEKSKERRHKSDKKKSRDSSVDDDSEHEKSKERRHKYEKKKSRDSSVDDDSEQEKSKERKHKSDKKKTIESSDESDDEAKYREKKNSEKRKSDKPSTSKDTYRDKHKHSKKEESKRHDHSSKTKDTDRKSKSKSEDKERVKDKGDDKKEKKKKMVNGSLTHIGIDSGCGTSFAEALGMCEPSSSKSSSKKKTSEKKDKPASKVDDAVPKLLKEPTMEPIDLNLSSLLPSITPNYRPLGNLLSSEAQPKKLLSESETLARIITSKNQRTKVYSGNKTGNGKVQSLFDLCTRVLQDNIDALEYTGGVPYLILKPILEKATPNQLYIMEHHNPYLIEDTDELWQCHCQKEFKNKRREELETCREMYLRCLDERDAKLKALTANIKQSQDKSLPVRMTKLAYVETVAKPPRNIARKQAKNGTAFDNRKPAVTPSSRLNSLATAGEAGKVAVPNPGSRAVERSSSHAPKPKKAPLMLKSISSFKNRFKR